MANTPGMPILRFYVVKIDGKYATHRGTEEHMAGWLTTNPAAMLAADTPFDTWAEADAERVRLSKLKFSGAHSLRL